MIRGGSRNAGLVSCLLAAVVSLGSCSTEGRGAPGGLRQLRIPIDRDIRTLDPRTRDTLDIVTHNVLRQLYEGLVDYDPATLDVVPRLARSWSTSPDGTLWTFDLHRGVRFADDPCFPGGTGREATAHDVKHSLETGLARRHAGPHHIHAPPIRGLADFLAGRADEITGIVAGSTHELTIRLERADPALLHFLARPVCYVVPREAVEAYGDGLDLRAVGTGPFRLVSWDRFDSILLVRRPDYWRRDDAGRPLPYLDVLRFIVSADSFRLYAQGGADMFASYLPSILEVPDSPLGEERRFTVSWLNVIYVRFDYASRHPIVTDRRLRRAVGHAMERAETHVHLAARGLLPPGLPGHDPALQGQNTDAALAAELLREAGHPGGRGLPPLKLVFPRADPMTGILLAAALRDLGVDTELTVADGDEFRALVREGRADLFRDGWVADYPDPQNFLQLFATGNPGNRGSYLNPTYDRLFGELRSEADAQRRRDLARRLEKILVDDAAAVFVRHERQVQFVSPRVDNWETNCTNPLNIRFYERVGTPGG